MNRNTILIFSLLLCLCSSVPAQTKFDLDWMLKQYRTSRDYLRVQSDSLISENNKKLFSTKVLPSVSLSATLPNFNNNITPITQPDGQEVFVNRNYANSNLSLYGKRPARHVFRSLNFPATFAPKSKFLTYEGRIEGIQGTGHRS